MRSHEKEVSAVELAQHAIARIERHDAKINAVCVRDFERALDAARAADTARTRGDSRPLLGIPLDGEEILQPRGTTDDLGHSGAQGFLSPGKTRLFAITRIKNAGGVILGKTNVPLGLGDWQSFNDIYGTTNNPYDL